MLQLHHIDPDASTHARPPRTAIARCGSADVERHRLVPVAIARVAQLRLGRQLCKFGRRRLHYDPSRPSFRRRLVDVFLLSQFHMVIRKDM